MNILKIGLILLSGAGLSFGVDKLADTEMLPSNNDYYYMEEGYCHGDSDFLEHMLEDLSDEELLLVQGKIDELLVEYSITLEELNDDYNVRYDFMNDLMDFINENDIDYHSYRGYHDYNGEDDWRGGMGMH